MSDNIKTKYEDHKFPLSELGNLVVCKEECQKNFQIKEEFVDVCGGSHIFECPECSKCYSSYKGFSEHLGGMVSCPNAPEKDVKPSNLNEFTCSSVEEPNTSNDKSNDISNDKSNDKRYPCELCLEAFSTATELHKHLKTHKISKIATESKMLKCPDCTYKCLSLSTLAMHLRVHSGEKPFSCSYCSYSSTQRANLIKHVRTHTGEKPFTCPKCPYACSQQSSLKTHMYVHTDIRPFKCSVCSYTAKQKSAVALHERVHFSEKAFKCSTCEYSSKYKSDLKKHELIHSGKKPFECDLCSYSAYSQSNLKSHKFKHGTTTFKCEQCDFTTKHRPYLAQHRCVHEEKKQTEKVQKKKKLPATLVSGEPPKERPLLSCKECEYSTKNRAHYFRHIKKHSQDRPFKCGNCDYSTYRKDLFKNHLRRKAHVKAEPVD